MKVPRPTATMISTALLVVPTPGAARAVATDPHRRVGGNGRRGGR